MSRLPTSSERTTVQPQPERGRLGLNIGLGGVVFALLIGIQLGAIPWRYRREIWQLQGLLVGAGLGFVVGRFSRSDDRTNSNGQRRVSDRP
ncbi:MAG: hypothetical protein WCF98_02045 [Synechococcus sp. ELA057]